jgi:hypothetical protein
VSDRLDARLRRLPGVLDCSVLAGGVALLVHPEVDVRVLKARAQAIFAELGDERPLVIMGGLVDEPAPRPGWLAVVGRGQPTPATLSVFVVVVLCLLALVPLTPKAPSGPLAGPSSQPVTAVLASSITPDLARPVASWRRAGLRALAASAAGAAPVVSAPVASAAVVGRGRSAAGSNATRGARPATRPVARVLTTTVSLLPAVVIERAPVAVPAFTPPGHVGKAKLKP